MAGRADETYLDRILEGHRARAAGESRSLPELEEAASLADPPRGFAAAIGRQPGASVIAEVKRRSPSRGVLAPDLDPAAMARAYETGGAACLSVLTDAEHFGGSRADLETARGACSLPVLRKDFTVSVADIYEARAMGADAVLLIVAALSRAELELFLEKAAGLGLDALVEVHDESELEVALACGASLVGVNQRDLRTFELDRARARRLAASLPAGVISVGESGLGDPEEVAELAAAGFDAVLVGESFVTAPDPAAEVARFVRAGRPAVSPCG